MKLVAEGEYAFLGTAFLLAAPRAAEGSIKLVLVEGTEQSLRLHEVGMHFRAVRERPHTSLKGFLVAFHDELPPVFAGIPVAELKHFLEFPTGINVHQGKGDVRGRKPFQPASP